MDPRMVFGLVLLVVILFYFLGRAADLVVKHSKSIAVRLGIEITFLGFILGFFTSFPELAIAVNATLTKQPSIALGNLLGGIPVLFGLVLGLNIVFRRTISTSVNRRPILGIVSVLFLPLLLAMDGQVSSVDGFVLMFTYGVAFVSLMLGMAKKHRRQVAKDGRNGSVVQSASVIILSVLGIAVLSNLIVRFTELLLAQVPVPPFFVGLILFALGTNLPEIIISLRAYQRHDEDLSISNIVGSAMANILIIGLMALITPLALATGVAFYVMFATYALLLITVATAYRSGGKFTRGEGIVLVLIYLLFAAGQFLFAGLR